MNLIHNISPRITLLKLHLLGDNKLNFNFIEQQVNNAKNAFMGFHHNTLIHTILATNTGHKRQEAAWYPPDIIGSVCARTINITIAIKQGRTNEMLSILHDRATGQMDIVKAKYYMVSNLQKIETVPVRGQEVNSGLGKSLVTNVRRVII